MGAAHEPPILRRLSALLRARLAHDGPPSPGNPARRRHTVPVPRGATKARRSILHVGRADHKPERPANRARSNRIPLILYTNEEIHWVEMFRFVKYDFSIKPITVATAATVRYGGRNHCSPVYKSREKRRGRHIFSYINAHLAISIRGPICKGQIAHKTCNVVILSSRLCRYFMPPGQASGAAGDYDRRRAGLAAPRRDTPRATNAPL